MTVLVTGADGLIGWPLAVHLAERDVDVVGVDNFARREWVDQVGGQSIVPLESIDERLVASDYEHFTMEAVDLTDREHVYRLVERYRPEVVIHLAAQPSAPFSQRDADHAIETQVTNLTMTLNLLWALHDVDPAPLVENVPIVETTTAGLYGSPPIEIPEGGVDVLGEDGTTYTLPYPNMGGSWYHLSKGFDAANLRLANRQWGQPVAECRTGIVYGVSEHARTRVDFDFHFGTVVNRFCAQAVAGHPLTVYGAGEQRKPFIHVDDVIAGLAELATGPDRIRQAGHVVYNQAVEARSIVDVASVIVAHARGAGYDATIEHVDNPRSEDETHELSFEGDRYAELLRAAGQEPTTIEGGVGKLLEWIGRNRDVVLERADRFLADD